MRRHLQAGYARAIRPLVRLLAECTVEFVGAGGAMKMSMWGTLGGKMTWFNRNIGSPERLVVAFPIACPRQSAA